MNLFNSKFNKYLNPQFIPKQFTQKQPLNIYEKISKVMSQKKLISDKHDYFNNDLQVVKPIQFEKYKYLFSHGVQKYELTFKQTQCGVQSIQYQANYPTQDRIVVKQLKGNQGMLLAVFDGHGGGHLANQCANKIHQHFQNIYQELKQMQTKKAMSQSLTQAFNRLEQTFLQKAIEQLNTKKKYKRIGSCALCCIITKDFVIVANAGDSKALLVSTENGESISLNEMFNTHNQNQQQRLLKQFPKEDILVSNSKNGAKYLKGCLLPTRCFGDFHLKRSEFAADFIKFTSPYITHDPDIVIQQLNPQMKYYLVLGSDGLWDELNDDQVSKTLLQSLDNNKADALLDAALQRIAQKHQTEVEKIRSLSPKRKRDFHDDISIIVADLQKIY